MKKPTPWRSTGLIQGASTPPPSANKRRQGDASDNTGPLKILIGVMIAVVAVLLVLLTGVFGGKGSSSAYLEDVAQHVPADADFMFAARSPESLKEAVEQWVEDDVKDDLHILASQGDSPFRALGEDKLSLETLKERGVDPEAAFGLAQWSSSLGVVDLFSAGATGGDSAAEKFASDTLGPHALLDQEAQVEDVEIDGHRVFYSVSSSQYSTRSVAVVSVDKRLLVARITSQSGTSGERPSALDVVESILRMEEQGSLAEQEGFESALEQVTDSDFAMLSVGESATRAARGLGPAARAAGDLTFALLTFKIGSEVPYMRAHIGLKDEDAPLLKLLSNEELSAQAFEWAPGPAEAIALFRLDSDTFLDDGMELAEDISGVETDRALEDTLSNFGVDPDDLFDAIGDELGVVVRELPSGGTSPAWMSRNVLLFLAVTDREPFVAMLEESTRSALPGAEFQASGEGHLLSIGELDAGIGVDDDYLWIGALGMVEQALGHDAESVNTESSDLIDAFPSDGVMSLSMRPEFFVEQQFRSWTRVYPDISLPDAAEVANVANFSLTLDGQLITFEASIALNEAVAREAFSEWVKATNAN